MARSTAVILITMVLVFSSCLATEGRRALAEEKGIMSSLLEGTYASRSDHKGTVIPPPALRGEGSHAKVGFSARQTGKSVRILQSVPSPGVGH
ncbi:hypothetical protein Nepgr_026750 [Nepenthes gracilis]|uniref:Uncharacterized protein n=1 Tax=Nepenthes gracilis TaxID=150966 RepID=A0AAD3T8R9_NEPGR|nr:hypothetical protein Nepgr_026750 [Nepenthes gracilis]